MKTKKNPAWKYVGLSNNIATFEVGCLDKVEIRTDNDNNWLAARLNGGDWRENDGTWSQILDVYDFLKTPAERAQA